MDFYFIQPGDTLESIATSYNTTVDYLKSLNSFTPNLNPGSRILIPNGELSLTNEVYYSTRLGKVKGNLTITEHVIVFDPIRRENSCEILTNNGTTLGDPFTFQSFIDLNDVIHCNVFELQGSRGSRSNDQVFYIELMLSRTGREKRGVRSEIPKVNVYFKLANILSNGETLQYIYLKTKADQILALVSSSLMHVDRNREDSGTFVPFYEVNKGYLGRLNSGLEVIDSDEEFKEIVSEMMSEEKQQQQENFILPEMLNSSKIMTPKIITQILASIPSVFQYRSWELLYSISNHGRSINSFYNYTDKSGPNILVVKDNSKFIFGGYFSNSWRKSSFPYGTGECFVFTFKNHERIKIFYTTMNDNCYMSSDSESIMIGAGQGAAIFIDKNLEAGYSSKSITYNNQVLSGESHFQIIDLEVWRLV